jgi:hypothetical protein
MRLPKRVVYDKDEVVYALEYPNGGHHAIHDDEKPESLFGIICCRDEELMETWLKGLNIKALALGCEVVETTLGKLMADEPGYTLWLMDNGFDDREIIHF